MLHKLSAQESASIVFDKKQSDFFIPWADMEKCIRHT